MSNDTNEMDCDDVKNSEMTDEEAIQAEELRLKIKSGELDEARTFLEKLSPELRKKFTRPNEDRSISLVIHDAIIFGELEFVKFLVQNCDGDITERAMVDVHIRISETRSIKWCGLRMTSLEVAIYYNKPHIIEYLVGIGADVEAAATDKKAIHIACLAGALKIVQLLIDNGAELNTLDNERIWHFTGYSGHSCLMKALVGDNVEVCRFLLDKGADINFRNDSGDTVLHIAAKSKSHKCAKLLLERGADPFCKNSHGDDPLRVASMYKSQQIAEFFLETVFKGDVNRRVEHFLTSGIYVFSPYNSRTKAIVLSSWKRGVELYVENQMEPIPTILCTPIGLAVEVTSMSELNDLSQDDDKFLLQMIVLTYKIFGSTHSEFYDKVRICADVYFENRFFDKGLLLLMFCFQITRKDNLAFEEMCSCLREINFYKDRIIRKIFRRSLKISQWFETVYGFLEAIVEESAKYNQFEDTELFMRLTIYCIWLLVLEDCNSEQKLHFMTLMRSASTLGRRSSKGQTLVMEALLYCSEFSYLKRGIRTGLSAIGVLLECGAEVNDRDHEGNNVIHLLVKSIDNPRQSDAFKKLAAMFVENGVHLDARNKAGVEVASLLRENGIAVVPPINLMCYAARAIRRLNIPYVGVIPKLLVDFVEMH